MIYFFSFQNQWAISIQKLLTGLVVPMYHCVDASNMVSSTITLHLMKRKTGIIIGLNQIAAGLLFPTLPLLLLCDQTNNTIW